MIFCWLGRTGMWDAPAASAMANLLTAPRCFSTGQPFVAKPDRQFGSRTQPGRRLVISQAGASPKLSLGNKLQSLVSSPPKLISKDGSVNFATAGGVIAVVCVVLFVRDFFLKRARSDMGGSVADLIRRGQLRSDRKSDMRPLKYEDPFNNPMVKIGSKNPIVRMCGKMFRLAPVTLTEEKVVSHQNRRVQAYQWRRPVVFLNEGDPVPEGVDPDAVRWIPSNHPFATTTDFIDEESAQKNVYQTRGVPSRLRAEHEALRKKMQEAAQMVQGDAFQEGSTSSPFKSDTETTLGTVADQES